MAIITWSTALTPAPGSGFGQRRYDLQFSDDSVGEQQTRLLGPPRWQLSILQPDLLTPLQAGHWQALVLQLRGRVNHLACWNFGRPVPMGTLRGTPTLSASAAAGATSVAIAGGGGNAGATLLRGDMLQIGTGLGTSQLVMVTEDETADGSGAMASVAFEPPLRTAFASATAVAWERPLAYFKAERGAVAWEWQAGPGQPYTTSMTLDLLESWTS
jgi:hypothetical protein